MLDPGEFFTSLASIATLEAVSVANIDSPTELNSQVGSVNGERRVAYQAGANDDVYTVYYFDSTDGAGVSSPYVMAASGSGFWIASGGKYTNSAVALRSTLAVTGTITGSSTVSGTRLISTIAIGTAPLTVTSTTVVPNLNVSQLLGATWAAPGTIGSGTPSTGAFTTISASGVITSTLVTGTAPFTVASTTVVGNLNVSQLLGGTWAVPGSIGATTPNAGAFTTLTANGATTLTGDAAITGTLVATSAAASSQFFFSDASTNIAPSVFQYGHKSSGTPAASFGAEVDCLLHSSTNVSRAAFATVTTWVVPTDASRTARTQFYALDTGFRECIRIEASGSVPMVGLYGTAAAIQYATTGTSTGFTAGAGTTATSLSTFTGNTGSTAYTVGDIVRALKLIGVMAA